MTEDLYGTNGNRSGNAQLGIAPGVGGLQSKRKRKTIFVTALRKVPQTKLLIRLFLIFIHTFNSKIKRLSKSL